MEENKADKTGLMNGGRAVVLLDARSRHVLDYVRHSMGGWMTWEFLSSDPAMQPFRLLSAFGMCNYRRASLHVHGMKNVIVIENLRTAVEPNHATMEIQRMHM